MDQMVRNDIACNCIPIVRIAFRYALISFYLLFLRLLIAYLRKYAAYLGCCFMHHNVVYKTDFMEFYSTITPFDALEISCI